MTKPETTAYLKAKLLEFQNLTPAKPCRKCPGCKGKEEESLKRASQCATTNQIVR